MWAGAGSGAAVVAVVVAVVLLRARSRSARERAAPAGAAPETPRAATLPPTGMAESGMAESATVTLDAAEPVPEAALTVPARSALLTAPVGWLPEHVRGRDELLARLGKLLNAPAAPDGHTQVLAGAGGTGTSTVALWLAREADRRGRRVWWVPAADARTLSTALLEVAAEAGARPGEVAQAIAGERDPADLLWRCLAQSPPWLLVFDGAGDPGVLAGWLRPTAGGLIVVTSRDDDMAAWGEHADVHVLGALDPADGGSVLRDRAPGAGSARQAAALAERLGGLPLALHLAGSQLASGAARRTFGRYAKALTEHAEHDDGRAEPDIAAVAVGLSLDALAASGRPQARALLRVLSCLAPTVEVPAGMLEPSALTRACDGGAAPVPGGSVADAVVTDESAAEVLAALSRAGLVVVTRDHHEATAGPAVHALVSQSCRARMSEEDLARAAGGAVAMLSAAAGRLNPAERADWTQWLRVTPHLNAVYEHLGGHVADADLAALSDVAAVTALAFLSVGYTAAAAALTAAALGHAERLGPDHEAVLAVRCAVARTLAHQGRAAEAELEFRDVLAARARVLGPDHRATLATRCQIAAALAGQGRFGAAERELRDAASTQVRVLGAEHADTLATRFEIGRTLAQRGEYQRAEAEFRDLLRVRARAGGRDPRHPDTLAVRYQLARLLVQRGDYEQAERELRELLADSGTLGADHPSMLTTRQDFALLLAERGQYDQAARELRDLLTARVRVLGPEHRQTRLTQRWLSYVAARDATVRSE